MRKEKRAWLRDRCARRTKHAPFIRQGDKLVPLLGKSNGIAMIGNEDFASGTGGASQCQSFLVVCCVSSEYKYNLSVVGP